MKPFVWHVCVDRLTRMSLASREPAPPWVSMIAPARSPAWQRGVLCAPAPDGSTMTAPSAATRPARDQRAESERHGSLQAVGRLTLTATSANDHPRPPRLGARQTGRGRVTSLRTACDRGNHRATPAPLRRRHRAAARRPARAARRRPRADRARRARPARRRRVVSPHRSARRRRLPDEHRGGRGDRRRLRAPRRADRPLRRGHVAGGSRRRRCRAASAST